MRNGIRYAAVAWIAMIAVIGSGIPSEAAKKLPRRRVACMETITESLRVANDLDCDEDGLVVGAPGITIDLDGHRITGDGGTDDFGIVNAGHDEVKIRNGSVSNFDVGVYVIAADRNKVGKILATEHNDGILLESSTRSSVGGSTATRNAFTGIQLFNTEKSTVKNSTTSANGSDGLRVIGSPFTKLYRNSSTGNGGEGAEVFSSPDSTLERNRMSGNTGQGILLSDSVRGVLERNKVNGGDLGGVRVESGSDDSKLVSNSVSANDQNGIVVTDSDGSKLKSNNASGNGGAGILLDGSEGSKAVENTASKNVASGIWVLDGAGNVIVANVANRNGEDGILSNTDDVKISKNKANENGFLSDPDGDDNGLGIFAPPTTPGKSNTARGNDDPVECDPSALCT